MPTYDYKCPDCGHAFEVFQTMTAAPVKKCPECGKRKVKRLIGSGLGVIFKGSGFYETDYVKKSGKPDKAESKTESKDAAGSSTGKTDSKPAKKEPAKAPAKKD